MHARGKRREGSSNSSLHGYQRTSTSKSRFDSQGRPRDIAGHSVPMAALGGFILLFGFLAFNGGSRVKFAEAV